MFEFNVDSVVVKSWVKLIKDNKRTKQQVPDLYNLRELVYGELEK